MRAAAARRPRFPKQGLRYSRQFDTDWLHADDRSAAQTSRSDEPPARERAQNAAAPSASARTVDADVAACGAPAGVGTCERGRRPLARERATVRRHVRCSMCATRSSDPDLTLATVLLVVEGKHQRVECPGTPISVTPGSEDVVGRLLHATAPVAVAVSDF